MDGTVLDGGVFRVGRRDLLAGMLVSAIAAGVSGPARAAGLGGALGSLLGHATDSSLDKLAQPGGFFNDSAIRIGLPGGGGMGGGGLGASMGGLGGALGSAMGAGGKLGLTSGLTRSLNDAAGAAATQAKPIFHAAISRLSLGDVPGIAQQSDGATQYLRRSAGDELNARMRPLIDQALESMGAYGQLDALGKSSSLIGAAGLNRDSLGRSVTGQALNGIFRYIGVEEGRLRANPLGPAGGLLGGLMK